MDFKPRVPSQPQISSGELNVVREEADWLVVEKPAHLLIHPTRPDGTLTLWELLRERYGEGISLINRLDRETSGLVLVSRTREAASVLGKLTMERRIEKRYFALVWGKAPESGTINAPIDRLGKYGPFRIYIRQGVVPEGASAVTHFQKLEERHGPRSGEVFSLLEVRLETGRLHQIRVHLSHIGHPVVGDKIYGPDEQCYLDFIEHGWSEELEARLLLPRHALHAYRMAFGWEGERVEVETPLPDDLASFRKA